jgi:hypothetical protein
MGGSLEVGRMTIDSCLCHELRDLVVGDIEKKLCSGVQLAMALLGFMV